MPQKPQPLKPKNHDWSRFLIENTPGAFITVDQEGRITEFNPAAERLTGFSLGAAHLGGHGPRPRCTLSFTFPLEAQPPEAASRS